MQRLKHFIHSSLIAFVLLYVGNATAATGMLRVNVFTPNLLQHEGTDVKVTYISDERLTTGQTFAELADNFEVINIIEGTPENWRASNGQLVYQQEWVLSLFPKKTGTVKIPPITINGITSRPRSINVTPVSGYLTAAGKPRRMFAETLIEKKEAWVNSEVMLTYRVYIEQQAYDGRRVRFDEPEPENAEVFVVSQTRGRQRIGTTNYIVSQKQVALYPQKSGVLHIPQFVAIARVREMGSYSLSNLSFEKVLARSEDVEIKVLPQQNTQGDWLPAKDLALTESFDKNTNELKLGDALSRTVTITATGVTPSALPTIDVLQQKNLGVFGKEKPKVQQTITKQGVVTKKTFSFTLLPKAAGTLTLPEISISYWHVGPQAMKTATLGARTYTVIDPNATTESATETPEATPTTATTSSEPTHSTGTSWWTVLLLILWLITLAAFAWREWLRRKPSPQNTTTTHVHTAPTSFKLKKLEAACNAGDAAQAKQLLLAWGEQHVGHKTSLSALARHVGDDLGQHFLALDQHLYAAQTDVSWDGDALYAAFESWQTEGAEQQTAKDGTPLPTLYQ